MPHRNRGFTLIELMIVIVIVGILVTVALPAFNQQIRKSRRSDAIAQLQALVLKQEKWRADHATYGACSDIGVPTLDHYTLTCSGASANGFTVTATAIVGDGQNIDRGYAGGYCTPLEIVQLNGSQTKTPDGCWR